MARLGSASGPILNRKDSVKDVILKNEVVFVHLSCSEEGSTRRSLSVDVMVPQIYPIMQIRGQDHHARGREDWHYHDRQR